MAFLIYTYIFTTILEIYGLFYVFGHLLYSGRFENNSAFLASIADGVLGLLRFEDVQEFGSICGIMDKQLLQGIERTISALEPLLLDAEKKASYNRES